MNKTITILTVMLMLIIFILSSCDAQTSALQSDFIINLLKEFINLNSFFVRKLAHFSLFFLLEILIYNLLNNIKYKGCVSIFIVSIYAICDEIHQYFVPGRSCEIRDMIIDISGCIVAFLLLKLWRYINVKRTDINEKNSR
jgi:VanZ family protein